ncbi:hypothetical protein SEUCBS139899_010360 [Sporothrix eucalyptigena]|uniref:Asp/Glu/hydantoin racemase n=1 Tax=Sporothrix eucalyptigena TaxID=1812306 RepID=A0ABP0CLY0_9PEZI
MRSLRLGVIVPSSNTALEPLTQQIVASLNADDTINLNVTVHFSRFRVTTIALSDDANAQFALGPMLDAARLLADAHVDVIGWSGTSASWLGFGSDEVLCSAIQEATGIPATTAVQGMNWILETVKDKNVGLVTPYTPDVNEAIRKNYARVGITITDACSRYAGLSDNVSFAAVGEPTWDKMVEAVVKGGAQTVLIMCTNVRAAHRARHWETLYADQGLRVLDSVATTVMGMLRLLNADVKCESITEQWGHVFDS